VSNPARLMLHRSSDLGLNRWVVMKIFRWPSDCATSIQVGGARPRREMERSQSMLPALGKIRMPKPSNGPGAVGRRPLVESPQGVGEIRAPAVMTWLARRAGPGHHPSDIDLTSR